jgi:zinc/manganese transport system permease protein
LTVSLWHYAFVQQALLVGVITAIMTGIVGPFVAARNLGFAVHGLAEVGFTGAAAAVLIGASAEVGVFVAAVLAALAIGALGVRLRERDVAIGSVLALGMGFGVLFLTLYTRYATEAFSILFGTILAVSRADVVSAAAASAVALAAVAVIYRPLSFASVDPEAAAARGVPVGPLSTVFLLILALAVTEAVEVVGVLLILTLLITPAGAARHLTANPAAATLLSVAICLVVTLGGIAAAVYTSWPVSFFVAAFSFVIYVGARIVGPRRRGARSLARSAGEGATGPPRDDAVAHPR